jgi:hypothetical protein
MRALMGVVTFPETNTGLAGSQVLTFASRYRTVLTQQGVVASPRKRGWTGPPEPPEPRVSHSDYGRVRCGQIQKQLSAVKT